MKSPYEILGIGKNATDAEIKSAYKKMAMKYHPDKNAGDKAAEDKFKEINNAYDILKDPKKKSMYDQFGSAAFAGGNSASASAGGFNGNPFGGGQGFGGFNFDMSEMMDEVLKNFGFGGHGSPGSQSPGEHRGRDMLHTEAISLEEAYNGKDITVKFQSNVACEKCSGHGTKDGKSAPSCQTCRGRGYVRAMNGFFMSEQVCPDCQGLGRKIKDKCSDCDGLGVRNKKREVNVKIPAGVENGARLRLGGMGEAGALGGQAGDLYIDIRIRPHNIFERHGRDLLMRADVNFATLALGGKIDIETISGKTIELKIPSGTQIGERLRIKGFGMPNGDLYVEVRTTVPKKLSRTQKKALEEFQNG